jgi:hypothetical protein
MVTNRDNVLGPKSFSQVGPSRLHKNNKVKVANFKWRFGVPEIAAKRRQKPQKVEAKARELTSMPLASMANRSQIATSSQKHRDPRRAPFAFTDACWR